MTDTKTWILNGCSWTAEEIKHELGFYEYCLKRAEKELEDFTTLLLQTHYKDYNKRVEDFKWKGSPTFGYTNDSATRVVSDKKTLSWINEIIKWNKEKIILFKNN